MVGSVSTVQDCSRTQSPPYAAPLRYLRIHGVGVCSPGRVPCVSRLLVFDCEPTVPEESSKVQRETAAGGKKSGIHLRVFFWREMPVSCKRIPFARRFPCQSERAEESVHGAFRRNQILGIIIRSAKFLLGVSVCPIAADGKFQFPVQAPPWAQACRICHSAVSMYRAPVLPAARYHTTDQMKTPLQFLHDSKKAVFPYQKLDYDRNEPQAPTRRPADLSPFCFWGSALRSSLISSFLGKSQDVFMSSAFRPPVFRKKTVRLFPGPL